MRVALVMHGQPRFAKICYDHVFKHIIEHFKADVFFHSWWSPRMVGTLYPCAMHARRALTEDDRRVTVSIKDELLAMYNPRAYEFEDYQDVKPLIPGTTINFQYYSQWQAKRIFAIYHPSYDLIIRTRFDLMIQQDITFVLDDNFWVAGACPYTDGRVNDMFSFSKYEWFNDASNTYINLHKFEQEGNCKSDMEWGLAKQIKLCRIPVRIFPADFPTFDILRTESANKFR